MFLLKFLVIIAVARLNSGENIFFEKLEKLLNYCLMHHETVDSGTIIGVSFAKGQLLAKRRGLNTGRLIAKCEELQELFVRNEELASSNGIVSISFINSSLFTEIFPTSFKKLPHHEKAFPSIKTYLQLLNDNRNLPNGFSSDYCLAKIFNDCRSNEVCRKIEDVEESSFGYPQTHKLLYHLLDHVTCKSQNIDEISRICSRIYHESVFISNKISLVPELKDLFMEQIFLCSFAGFDEFLNNDWIKHILSWQKHSGCFSYDNVLCSSHMNGLAAASFALFARKLDEIYEI